MLEDILISGLSELSLPCSPEALRAFRRYYELLEERNRQMNLTAIKAEDEVARLHFLDCAAVLPFLPEAAITVLDIGSGAGFPGLVWKILRPELSLTLLDSQQKRVHFQMEVCTALGLQDVSCIAARAEEAAASPMRECFDVVTSRAVSRLNILAELALPFTAVGGCFLAMKGTAAAEELKEASSAIRLLGGAEGRLLPCPVPGLNAERSLVSVEKLRPTPAKYPRRFALIKKQPL